MFSLVGTVTSVDGLIIEDVTFSKISTGGTYNDGIFTIEGAWNNKVTARNFKVDQQSTLGSNRLVAMRNDAAAEILVDSFTVSNSTLDNSCVLAEFEDAAKITITGFKVNT